MGGIAFLNRIDEVLKDFSLSRNSFAEGLGISKGTMSTWKSRDILPIANTASKIAHALGVSVEWLIDGSENSTEDESLIIKQRQEIRENIYTLARKKATKSVLESDDIESEYFDLHRYLTEPNIFVINYHCLYNWAKCRYSISYSQFEKLAYNLGVSVNELLLKSSSSNDTEVYDVKLYEKAISHKEALLMLDSLTPENREKMESILKDTYKLQNLESANK